MISITRQQINGEIKATKVNNNALLLQSYGYNIKNSYRIQTIIHHYCPNRGQMNKANDCQRSAFNPIIRSFFMLVAIVIFTAPWFTKPFNDIFHHSGEILNQPIEIFTNFIKAKEKDGVVFIIHSGQASKLDCTCCTIRWKILRWRVLKKTKKL